eukprot:TRINITY_DN35448_c0_g1_i1.p1 TRINITY_DN35448_c0_g1~~TRINITY_DN35448_c0_g1_i1.p1  ORF type:complete len:396 (-),score=94.19 TRINITY_DN35448_c0_g1_i1:12-1199(-)
MPPSGSRKKATTPSQAVTELPSKVEQPDSAPAQSSSSTAKSSRPTLDFAETDTSSSHVSCSATFSQDDFVTVIVTPKLSFQLSKRPEWKTVSDISQEELRKGFLSRFPPALWMSSEKFSFKPALPPLSQITEETRSLVFKIVSEDVSDERVMLGILRELEKSYEAIIRRAVNETRSEALHEQLSLQEQAEEARREQEKQVKELRKENKGLRDQLQSIQKRLFLVEQEKDQLRKEQQQLNDRTSRLEQARTAERAEQQQVREQMELLRQGLEQLAKGRDRPSMHSKRNDLKRDVASAPQADDNCQRNEKPAEEAEPCMASRARAPQAEKADASTQTKAPSEVDAVSTVQVDPAAVEAVSRRVDNLQQQLGGLQTWILQGSKLFSSGGDVTSSPKDF